MTSVGRNQQRSLLPVNQFDGPVLVQGSMSPVFRDDWPQEIGIDYLCGHCQSVVIAASIADDQIWDIAFKCFACKGLSASPSLPAGMALPSVYVLTPKGRYLISDTVYMRRAGMVGEEAHDRRNRETGGRGSTFGRRGGSAQRELSPALLQSYVDELRWLLGDTYDNLYLSDCRARKSSTPSNSRHGLMVVVESLEAAIESFNAPSPVVDARAVTEIDTLLVMLRRWKQHPYWPKLVSALHSEYEHTAITLAVASFLEDAGNGIMFNEPSSGRTPDLQLVTAPQLRATLEIKAPRALFHSRTAELTPDKAGKVIRSAVKKAGTGRKGQLTQKQTGLLGIGGFALSDAEIDRLNDAATEYLKNAARAGRHSHILAISVVSIGTIAEFALGGSQATCTSLSGTLSVRVAQNPGYRGDIRLAEQTQNTLNRIEGTALQALN